MKMVGAEKTAEKHGWGEIVTFSQKHLYCVFLGKPHVVNCLE